MNIANKNKQYRFENHLVSSCQYHVIFCPKYRRAVLLDTVATRLDELIRQRVLELGGTVLALEIMPEHVHLLLDISAKTSIHFAVCQIKGYTSKILRSEFPKLKSRLPSLWTHSKFISTVGEVSLETVKQYIENQKGV